MSWLTARRASSCSAKRGPRLRDLCTNRKIGIQRRHIKGKAWGPVKRGLQSLWQLWQSSAWHMPTRKTHIHGNTLLRLSIPRYQPKTEAWPTCVCLYVCTQIHQRGLYEHTAQAPAYVGNAVNLGSAGTHEDISHAEKRPSRKNKTATLTVPAAEGRFPAAAVGNYHHTLGTRLSSGTDTPGQRREKIRARPGVQTLSMGTVTKSML